MDKRPDYSSRSFMPLIRSRKAKSNCLPRKARYRNNPNDLRDILNKSNNSNSSPSTPITLEFPWIRQEEYTCGVIGLHEEINDFYQMMKPSEREHEIRLGVVEHITKIVHSRWPLAKVEVFGSFRTGMYLPSSDIDMVICGEWRNLPLSTLRNALSENGIMQNDITVIANARVPIVRLVHTPSKIKVDISFNRKNGVNGAKLIKKYIKEYPVLPKLVLVLKQFLVYRDLNEVFNGGMSSYCLTMLIVSMLQGFNKPTVEPSVNMGTLLIEFFELYGLNFNYQKVSIHFQNGGGYQERYRDAARTFLSVEDPMQAGIDIAKGSYLMPQLKDAFQSAFYLLSKAVIDSEALKCPIRSLLSLLFQIDKNVLDKRTWLEDNYQDISQNLSACLSKFS